MDDVLGIPSRTMSSMGWHDAPLRDPGILESALLRPQQAAYYEDADIALQAVLLALGISQGQPFLDGNKRTALAAMIVFLRMNGLRINSDPLPVALHLEAVADRHGTLEEATREFAGWLRERLQRIKDRKPRP
jgi:death on curing protein